MMLPPKAIRWSVAVVTAFLAVSAPAAAECEPSQDPSPASDTATGINFYNDTQYAMRVFWSGFDGFLEPYGDWIQPGDRVSYNTYVGHRWFVEVNTPEGAVCSSAISPVDAESCQMHVLYDNGIGYDGGYCDF